MAEAGDTSQSDIDVSMTQSDATLATEPSTPWASVEEFGVSSEAPIVSGLEGPNLDVILDTPMTVPMEVGHADISIRNPL